LLQLGHVSGNCVLLNRSIIAGLEKLSSLVRRHYAGAPESGHCNAHFRSL
jgi:hypothetical protein